MKVSLDITDEIQEEALPLLLINLTQTPKLSLSSSSAVKELSAIVTRTLNSMMEIKSEEELLTSAAMGGGGGGGNGGGGGGSSSSGSTTTESQPNTHHILVCALTTIGTLLKSLGTEAVVLLSEGNAAANSAVNPVANAASTSSSSNASSKAGTSVVDSICATLLHPSSSARLAAAWCMRSLAVALPSQRTPFILKCAEQLDALR